ncbi:hypothetical protein GGD67_005958 [Bradyrhizobium sp. IAR9]|uniref:DUF6418 domain-containing protein n=1 Tax=Bradyrhizobium sp. IAR9 TaxID=2663841 RepID=UPI0015C95917|nr:DUF6418 domain-containing protein [Bradyrhizobium sp. IAR9]NYG48473.1 hypothetical protein [Bradyrhizobium sp. IAR9]
MSAEFVIFAPLSVIAAGGTLAAMAWVALRCPALAMLYFFPLFAFAGRLVSVLYVDLFGPIFSEQLEAEIGPGVAAVPIAISQGLVIAAMLFSFRGRRVQRLLEATLPVLPPGTPVRISNLAFWSAVLFMVGLWIELVVRGPIPLFAAMERYDYTQQYGGPLHVRLIEWGNMLAFQLGLFFVAPVLSGKSFDRRFAFLFATMLFYLFLVGHRFSSFYASTSFFLIPIGAVLFIEQVSSRSEDKLSGASVFRKVGIAGGVLLVMTAMALAYSYVFVRGFEGTTLASKLSQRLLVQQGEMWWATFERVFVRGTWDGALAFHKLFIDPFDPTRNSTMQFLMEQALPLERAHFILQQGSAYTGGWPELCFELGGPIGGFLLVLLSAIAFSEFMFLLTRCIVQERFVTCVFLTPLLYAMSIGVVTGMANSFIQWTFAAKIAVALIVYVTEDSWRSSMTPDPQPLRPIY